MIPNYKDKNVLIKNFIIFIKKRDQSFKSPSPIQPAFLNSKPNTAASTAGIITEIRTRPSQSKALG